MPTKKRIADALKERLSDVADRGRILGKALKVRAEIAAARRRLRSTFSELGEHVYTGLKSGELPSENSLSAFADRIDGSKAEVRMLEAELRDVMQAGVRRNGDHRSAGDKGV